MTTELWEPEVRDVAALWEPPTEQDTVMAQTATTTAVNTLWSDVSEFQVPVNNSYPYRFFALRNADGNHMDSHFMANVTWANENVGSRIWGYIVYYFYRPGVNGAAILKQRIGPKPNPRMVAMIDVESAGGQVSGNQSVQLGREFGELVAYLDHKRVIGYGNTSDLNSLWPNKPSGVKLIIAAYGSNPSYPNKFAHQFTDSAHTAPFGPSDLNSADGMSEHDLKLMFGMVDPTPPPPPPPPPPPVTGTKTGPVKVGTEYRWTADGTISLAAFAARRNTTVLRMLDLSAGNLNAKNFAALNNYVTLTGVKAPMPVDLVFYTSGP
jgi:hypothetical protein